MALSSNYYNFTFLTVSKVSPDNLEAFRIAQAIHQYTDGNQEERNTNQQTLGYGALVDVKEVGRNQSG